MSSLVGTWSNDGAQLRIGADASFSHQKRAGSSKTFNVHFTAPIQTWSESHFIAGIGPVGQTFTIDALPKRKRGTWTVTINGHELTRE